ncbi:hypothetical protein [Cellulophaga sp. L1A9]|uniref:hypothetical protein n=1 Tax=Cellulophaga sp. L1A9 TaxID=2686362 RepID=UPI00131E002B|nr:hypothetical protein [Cellulophaga sp. L1A9]
MSEYSPPKESLNYSKTLPIAEIEILDNNTIKKKWLGIYNRRTKKTEEIPGFFNWYDKECDKMKRIE